MSSTLRRVVVDADVLMNLVATGHLEGILSNSGLEGLVCPTTETEALYLNARAAGGSREPIDLAPSFALGSLVRCALAAIEVATFVRLASQVDDGEAQVLAVGHHRSLSVATDDRKARRVAADLGITLLSTPELVLPWASSLADPTLASSVINDIETRARYRPPSDSALRPAWDRLRSGS